MKKKILFITVIAIILTMAFTSCRKKEIAALEITEGLQLTLEVGQTPDYSNVKVKVIYNDDTSTVVGADDPDLKFSEIDTSTTGTKKLTVTYGGFSTIVNITVKAAADQGGDGTEVGYTIFGVDYDDDLKAFLAAEGNKKNFRGDSFDNYAVGHLNAFRFTLNINILDEDLNPAIISSYESLSRVYLIENGTETLLEGEALAGYVSIDESKGNNSFDFTEAAVGKTFRLETRPLHGVTEETEAYNTKSLVVDVVDAYNVYNAWELNLITNIPGEIIGDTEYDQLEAVTRFLGNNGVTRPNDLAGIVLHKNLSITIDDLPEEYFYTLTSDVEYTYTDKEGNTKTGVWAAGSKFFYDVIGVYNLRLTDEVPEFSIHGNYFTVYTYELPCVAPKGYGDNDNDLSGAELIRFDTDKNLIKANGHEKYKANVSNLYLRDDDGADDDNSASMRHKLGLIAFKTFRCVANLDQVNVYSYFISMHVNRDCQTVNINNCDMYNAWNNHILVWAHNDIDNKDATTLHAHHTPITVNITGDSRVAKCGGPVIINMVHNAADSAQSVSATSINIDESVVIYSYVTGSEAWFVANNATDIATQIKALNGLLQPSGGSFLTNLPNNPDTKFFNAIMVNMKYVSDASSVFSSDDLDGSMSIGDNKLLDMNDSAYGGFGNPYVSGYAAHSSLGKAPIFQSSNGTVGVGIMGSSTGLNAFNPSEQAIGMAVGSQGGYAIVVPNGAYQSSSSHSTGLAPADSTLYSGEYITIYYNNIGLVFGYNETPDSITEY